jgi:hypothetical protein
MVAGQGKHSDNEEVVLLEAALVVGILSVIVYGTIWLLMRPKGQRRPVLPAGQWRAAHYDVKGETYVVLQKVSPSGVDVLDEHVIATIPVGDPEYDAKFLTAMNTARERRALFEIEEDQ